VRCVCVSRADVSESGVLNSCGRCWPCVCMCACVCVRVRVCACVYVQTA
jgi:hypothetical protein